MTVMECVIAAANEIGLGESVSLYLKNGQGPGEIAVNSLVRCFNLVENQLALDYFPLYAQDEVETQTGAIAFSELEKPPVRIVKVMDENGKSLPWTLFPTYLKTQVGKVSVRYSFTPSEKNINDASEFLLHASVRMFSYGMASEYFAASGLFEEAAVWNAKYKDAIKAAYQQSPNKKIRSRRWI